MHGHSTRAVTLRSASAIAASSQGGNEADLGWLTVSGRRRFGNRGVIDFRPGSQGVGSPIGQPSPHSSLRLLSRKRDTNGLGRRNKMIEVLGRLGYGDLHAPDATCELVPSRSIVR